MIIRNDCMYTVDRKIHYLYRNISVSSYFSGASYRRCRQSLYDKNVISVSSECVLCAMYMMSHKSLSSGVFFKFFPLAENFKVKFNLPIACLYLSHHMGKILLNYL